jgi:DNA mismatch repair ATPase MutL
MSQSSSSSASSSQQEKPEEQQQQQEEEEEEEKHEKHEKHEQVAPIRLPRNSSLLKRDSTNRRKEPSSSTQKQQRKTKKPKRREQEADQQIIDRFHGSFHAVLSSLLRLVTWPIRYILTILLPHTFAGLTATAILLSLLYLLLISFQRFFASQLLLLPTTIPNPLDLLVQASSLVSSPIVYFYCSTLHAPFFCNHHHKQEQEEGEGREQKIAQYARTLSGSAQKASDIFDSVLLLSHPSHLGLHQAEILELAYAIRWSSTLEHRDTLAHQLAELADLSRSLKDMLIDLNGQSLNAFSFIAYQVRLRSLSFYLGLYS